MGSSGSESSWEATVAVRESLWRKASVLLEFRAAYNKEIEQELKAVGDVILEYAPTIHRLAELYVKSE